MDSLQQGPELRSSYDPALFVNVRGGQWFYKEFIDTALAARDEQAGYETDTCWPFELQSW